MTLSAVAVVVTKVLLDGGSHVTVPPPVAVNAVLPPVVSTRPPEADGRAAVAGEVDDRLPVAVLIAPVRSCVALLPPTWKAVPAALVMLAIELPEVAENVPVTPLRATPVVALPALVMVLKGNVLIDTVLRSTAGPPAAATVATAGALTPIRNPAEPV